MDYGPRYSIFLGINKGRLYLGRVDVSGVFLQQFGWLLCKAKSVQCSYST